MIIISVTSLNAVVSVKRKPIQNTNSAADIPGVDPREFDWEGPYVVISRAAERDLTWKHHVMLRKYQKDSK